MNPGDARLAASILRLIRQGAWTNDPADKNYAQHWQSEPLRVHERLIQTMPAAGTVGGVRTPVNIRVADGSDGRVVYIDTPKLTPMGPVASMTNRLRHARGADAAYRFTEAQTQIASQANGQVSIDAPSIAVKSRPQAHIGRVNELKPMDQLREAWRFARG